MKVFDSRRAGAMFWRLAVSPRYDHEANDIHWRINSSTSDLHADEAARRQRVPLAVNDFEGALSVSTAIRTDLYEPQDLRRLECSDIVPRAARRMLAIAKAMEGMDEALRPNR